MVTIWALERTVKLSRKTLKPQEVNSKCFTSLPTASQWNLWMGNTVYSSDGAGSNQATALKKTPSKSFQVTKTLSFGEMIFVHKHPDSRARRERVNEAKRGENIALTSALVYQVTQNSGGLLSSWPQSPFRLTVWPHLCQKPQLKFAKCYHPVNMQQRLLSWTKCLVSTCRRESLRPSRRRSPKLNLNTSLLNLRLRQQILILLGEKIPQTFKKSSGCLADDDFHGERMWH